MYLNPSLDNGEPVEQIVFKLFNLYLNLKLGKEIPVSYTHLTLPTSDLV